MKVICSFLLFTLLSGTLVAQNNMFIAFNINDCASCSRNMNYINSLNPNIKKNIILSQSLHADSAYINANFYLAKYGFSYLWSDSLYQQWAPEGYSSIALLQDDKEHRLMMPLKQFTRQDAELFNILSQPSMNLPIAGIHPLRIRSTGLELWVLDRVRMRIYGYHILTKNQVMLECTDSINSLAYDIFRGPQSYQPEMEALSKLGVPKKNEINDYWYDADTIFVISKHKYIDSSIKIYNDIAVNYFNSITKFSKSGRHISTSVLPVRAAVADGNYFIMPRLHQSKGVLYSAIGHANPKLANRKFLCTLHQQDSYYRAGNLLQLTLPQKHYQSLNHSAALFDSKFCMLPLEGVIYNMQNQSKVYDLHLVPENNKSSSTFEKPDVYITDFKMGNRGIWVLYADNRDMKYHMAVYNLDDVSLHKEVACYPIEPAKTPPVICDYNYNMIVITEGENVSIKKVL